MKVHHSKWADRFARYVLDTIPDCHVRRGKTGILIMSRHWRYVTCKDCLVRKDNPPEKEPL